MESAFFPSKCHFMVATNQNLPTLVSITFQGEALTQVDEMKYSGGHSKLLTQLD